LLRHVTKNAPADLLAYHEKDKEFPTHSTADQFYGHEKFEAYRGLGYFTAVKAIARMRKEPRRTEQRCIEEVV